MNGLCPSTGMQKNGGCRVGGSVIWDHMELLCEQMGLTTIKMGDSMLIQCILHSQAGEARGI